MNGPPAVRADRRVCGNHSDLSPRSRQLHVHYQETVLHIKDGLPKMKDMPKEMGGSGDTLPE